MIKELALVTLGGGVGSALRYLTSYWIGKNFSSAFPLATFGVNIVGCFLIGLLLGVLNRNAMFSDELNLLLIVGFCGGYTTFSTFSAENMRLYESGNYLMLVCYIISSILAGFFALWGGTIVYKVLS